MAAASESKGEVVIDHDVGVRPTLDEILVLDFGSQFSHLIVRRIRELNVYCEMHSCLMKPEVLARKEHVKGIILSGGPFSVYEDGAPHMHEAIWKMAAERGIPLLGVCYGFQEMAHILGGKVEGGGAREYGHAILKVLKGDDQLFKGVTAEEQAWMSHGDRLTMLPEGFEVLAKTDTCPFAAASDTTRKMWGLQYHPEVMHTKEGKVMLKNFVLGICGAKPEWSMDGFLDAAIEDIRNIVGPEGRVIGAVSGGVDSTVAAVLLNKAIGDRFHAVMVDNGLLRKNEAAEVNKRLKEECGVNITIVDATEQFLTKLEGIEDPEKKRKIIGATFIHVFEAEAAKIGTVDFLLQGTLYPDVIESVSFRGPSATIKSHHNVGGLLDTMRLKLIEPLRELFKDEVRELGMKLGLPRTSVFRHPFPGPGLAIRILGAISRKGLEMLREADAIYLEELHSNKVYDSIAQAFAVLLPCKSVGVMGDGRTYEQVIAVRAVETTDYMTATWFHMPYDVLAKISTRIINEVRGVNRVVYDISSKPPATIEWE